MKNHNNNDGNSSKSSNKKDGKDRNDIESVAVRFDRPYLRTRNGLLLMTCPIVLLSVVCSTERMKIISFVSPIWYSCGFSFLWWKNTIKITQTCPQTNKIAKSIISSAKWIKETRTAFGFYLRGDLKLELFYGSSSIHVTFWKILYQRLIACKFF